MWEGGYLPPTVGTFYKIRVSKLHFRTLKKQLSRELNVVTKVLFLNIDFCFNNPLKYAPDRFAPLRPEIVYM